jgi:hypothetical protein
MAAWRVRRPLKAAPVSDYEVMIDGFTARCYVVQWQRQRQPEIYEGLHLALNRAAALFREYGPELEIEIHINRIKPPTSLLYSSNQLHKWNRNSQVGTPG